METVGYNKRKVKYEEDPSIARRGEEEQRRKTNKMKENSILIKEVIEWKISGKNVQNKKSCNKQENDP